ncbi:hypothetical protein [Megalodesulfovibrio gigas]|uniref:Uncharacterized protein n=1 Tax=Megalodesulfovibrio gigas (strain ATCC 19364 / DSM 1382 / NCIMB 9332 / VKM B-1759) TaxID=1121448 RepID=T2GD73_MEGG1|nr:hypothetical protein [Megalodesulfovibrio gigas]AGW14109.1 hypothetical protein DGI_2356 [Megalodesulfovibrio gigas DSM 1382 = ATCC 19364]
MKILTFCSAVLLLSLCLCSTAFAYREYRDDQRLFKRGCYIDNSRFIGEGNQVCGFCRNTGQQVCCNAFSQTNSYTCTVAGKQDGSNSAPTVSEAAAKACGCY